MVPLAARDEGRLGRVPDGDEVVLAACEDVFGVGGPADAGEAAVVGVEEVEEPGGVWLACACSEVSLGGWGGDVLLLEVVDYPQRPVL